MYKYTMEDRLYVPAQMGKFECAYATEGSAGIDLCAQSGGVICAGTSSGLISTGLSLDLPPGYWGKIEMRSGLAYKHQLSILGGVIDNDYKGAIFVIIQNNGPCDFSYNPGDRIAQLIIMPYVRITMFQAETMAENTHLGLGSTGA